MQTALKPLPQLYYACDVGDLVVMTSTVVREAIYENDETDHPPMAKGLTPFHSLWVP
jgi:hypothetical protein